MHLNLCTWIMPNLGLKAYNFIKLLTFKILAYTDLNIQSPMQVFQVWFWMVSAYNCIWQLDPFQKKISHRKKKCLMHPIVYYVKENNEKYHGTFPLRKYHWVFYCRLQMQPSYRGVHKSTDKSWTLVLLPRF